MLSLNQIRENIQIIDNWLIVKDTNKKLHNLFLYFKTNKVETAKQLLYNIRLEQTKLKVNKKKTRNKISRMIAFYKTQKNKAQKIKQGLDDIYHNQVIENI